MVGWETINALWFNIGNINPFIGSTWRGNHTETRGGANGNIGNAGAVGNVGNSRFTNIGNTFLCDLCGKNKLFIQPNRGGGGVGMTMADSNQKAARADGLCGLCG